MPSLQNPFSGEMIEKSSPELREIVDNRHAYASEARLAAINELERRGEATQLQLEERVRIVEANTQMQEAGNLMPSFMSLLKVTGDYVFTPIFVYINVLIFILMVATGVHAFAPSVEDLVAWGGNLRAFTLNGELWRLLTNTFLHGGIIHLLFNMYALLQVGFILEINLGKQRYIISYIACGVIASIASMAVNDNIVSVGASGAIFGLFGLLLSLLITKQLNIPQEAMKSLLSSTLIFVGYNLVFGFAREGIDNAAHIGGLVSGFVIGFMYKPSLKRSGSAVLVSCFIAGIVIVAILASPHFISNKWGEFQNAMEVFGANEEKALWMYRENMPLHGSEEYVRYKDRLQTEGVDLWKENLSVLGALKDMPDHLQTRIDLLTKYCELRIQSCEMLQASEDPETPAKKLMEVEMEINSVIDQLSTLNE